MRARRNCFPSGSVRTNRAQAMGTSRREARDSAVPPIPSAQRACHETSRSRGTDHRFLWSVLRSVSPPKGRRRKTIVCPTRTQLTDLFHDKRKTSLNLPSGKRGSFHVEELSKQSMLDDRDPRNAAFVDGGGPAGAKPHGEGHGNGNR